MTAIIRKLPAPAVSLLVLFICFAGALSANIVSIANRLRGVTPGAHDITDKGVLVLVIYELLALVIAFRIGRASGWAFATWGFRPSWMSIGAGVLFGLAVASPKFAAAAFLVLALLGWMGRLRGWSFTKWKSQSSPESTAADIFLCFALYLLAWAGNQLVLAIYPEIVPARFPVVSHLSVTFLLATVIVNPVFEETMETGFLIQSLQRYGIWVAVLTLAIFRGFLHAYLGLGAVVGNVSAGLIFGFIYWKWRKLWPLFVAHGLLDLFMLLRAHLT
jgi:membrane protease YdiL (CAAX protease family)